MKKGHIILSALAVVLLAAVCFAYWHHFNNPFHFDDTHTIVNNAYIRDIKNLPLFFKDARTFSSLPANQVYRPGVTTLNAFDYWIGGKPEPTPFYYHLSIFISFLTLGVFIYMFSLKLYNASFSHALNPFAALLTTAVYMLHTANAETINYIISRSDSFSTLMILVTLCVFAYAPKLRKFQLYLLPMLFGFFVKEPTIMVAPLLFLYLFLFEEKQGFNKLFQFTTTAKILFRTVGAFVLAVFLYWLSSHMAAATFTTGGYSPWEYRLTQTFVVVHYVNNYFFPFNLSADTDWGLIKSIFDERVTIGIAFIAVTLYVAYRTSLQGKYRPVSYGIIWFYLALLPTSVFPLAEVLNDHRVFFPYIGLTIAFVWSLFLLYVKYEERISRSRAQKWLILFVLFSFLGAHVYGVRVRSKVWSSADTLWYDVTVKSPRNGRGLMNYGNVLMSKGDYNGALTYFLKAKNEWPYYSYIYTNLGVLYNALGNPAEAERNFKYAESLNNANPEFYYFYSNFLRTQNRYQEALAMADSGLLLSPKHPGLNQIRNELTTNPDYAASETERIQQAEKVARESNAPEEWLNLSLIYYRANRFLDCVRAAEEALKIKPDYTPAYNNICSAYNMLGEWDKAIAAGEKGLQIDPAYTLLKNNLEVSKKGKAGNR